MSPAKSSAAPVPPLSGTGKVISSIQDKRRLLLSTLPADREQRRLALMVALALAVLFAVAAPFATSPLIPISGFIPIYASALTVTDVITAVLLISQFAILRTRALAVLAGGYFFAAF